MLPRTEWRLIIAECIERRIFSYKFVKAWATMEKLTGRLMELEALHKSAYGQYKREIATGSSTNLKAQMCWYSLWLKERGAIDVKSKRESAQDELLKICIDAHEGKLQCPINPKFYDAAWFRRLLRIDGKKVGEKVRRRKDIELTGSLDRLSQAELWDLASDQFIVASILPPLHRAAFTEISTAP